MSARRMGGMGKLSDFGKTAVPQPELEPPPEIQSKSIAKQPKSVEKLSAKAQGQEKLVTVNIKIYRSQQEWLADAARQVRDNNTNPVPASERVYPQHLIQIAIDLLQASNVDWQQIKSVDELKRLLEL